MSTVDVRDYPHYQIKGNIVNCGGDFGPTTRRLVSVSPKGVAYDLSTGCACDAERWGEEGGYLDSFCVDAGEFERCGITFKVLA